MQWSSDDDTALLRAVATGKRRKLVAEELSALFGHEVTSKAVERRLYRLAERGAHAKTPAAESELNIPIEWEDETVPDAAFPPLRTPVPQADRAFVDQGEPSYDFEPLDLGSRTIERVLLIPDTHAPFHDWKAWEVVMRFAKQWRPDSVVHVGDWADCFTISDHDKDPRRASQLEEELKVTRELRAEVDALPGLQRKVCTLGNHEFRLERYMMRNAPALISMLDIGKLMELPQNGWSVVPYKSHGRIGKLYVTHDAGHAGVHAIHHTGNAFCSSVAFGHTHRMGCVYFGDVTGRRHVSASLGWLGSLREAKYIDDVKKRYWTHGFGTLEMDRRGHFQLQLIPIVDYRCVLSGQTVSLKEAA